MAGHENNAYLLVEGGQKIYCLFNPTEFDISMSNSWEGGNSGDKSAKGNSPIPGKGVRTLSFSGSQNGSMNLTLFFDTTAEGVSVTTYTDKLTKLMEIDESLPGTNTEQRRGRPPTVQFVWGGMRTFPCVINSLNMSFKYFSTTGTPLRAQVVLGLTQYKEANAFGPQNPTSGTPQPHKVHRVQPGETLDRISAQHYGDATRWRVLAEANGIEDPLDVPAGSLLAIPKPT